MTQPEKNSNKVDASLAFKEKGSAARYSKIQKLLSVEASQLSQLIEASANPDQAVLQLEVLLQQHSAEALSAFESNALALRACVALFGSSQWLGQTLLQNPDLLYLFARPMGLVQAREVEDFREQFARFRLRSHQTPLAMLLARFKRREYVRIFTRELLGLASLAEITTEISALSDVLIERALMLCESDMRRRYQGWPQLRSEDGRVYPARFSVLALGKLGGNELNYSSDIDLLYLCDDAEDAGAIPISAREFFTRLAQDLTDILSKASADGHVFRVDLRLRPDGKSGEIVAGCGQALQYYRSVAQDWELQALLKLRPSAGDKTLAREFVEQVQELIYCKPLSLSAIQTAAHSLERIRRGVVRRVTHGLDVKNGTGGLREIEFVTQCLQRVHGGGEPWLRASGTLFALQKLHDKGHVGDAEFRELGATYVLLRGIEHRLQCRQGAPSHRLPDLPDEQVSLFRSMGEGSIGNALELRRIMNSASELCARVLRLGSGEATGEVVAVTASLGAPGAALLRRQLAVRSEALASALAADVGDFTLGNLQRFLAAASTEPQRIRTTLENVEWIERALPVFARSVLATNILARHPEDIVALFRSSGPEPERSVSDQLRIAARRYTLRSVGRTLLEARPAWETLRQYSEDLERVIRQALEAADAPVGFAVMAVGRLATCELDALSDADLVFLRSAECDSERAELCARSLVAMLSSYTREGSVIAVDTRLRPHGSEGELVVSSRQLAQYFEGKAKAWETLAFGKMRLIAGSEQLAGEASESLSGLRKRSAASPRFVPELRAIRKRIADSVGGKSLKTGPGGLYDLDFLVGMLETKAALTVAGKQLHERLEVLLGKGLLQADQGSALLHAAGLFRRVDHAIRVVEGRSRKWLPESDLLRAGVEQMVKSPDLASEISQEMQHVRAIFDSFFHD